MTPKERMSEYLKGNEVDRIPCFTFLGENATKLFNISLKDYYFSSNTMKEVEVNSYRTFGSDGIAVGTGLQGISEALGGIINYSDNELYVVEKPAISSYKEFCNLKTINPYEDGRLPILLKAIELIKKEVKDEVNVSIDIAGPISVAASIRGTSTFLKDLIKKPKEAHELLEFSTECNLEFVKAAYDNYGVGVSIGDPVASESVIGKKGFLEYANPYLKKCIDQIVDITGDKPTLHICGKTKSLWNYISELNISGFSVDNIEDILELKHSMGNKLFIIGNVDPVDILRFGTTEDVMNESKLCIDKAMNSPKGFALAPGCQIPLNTPKENIEAMINAARIYGKNARISSFE